MLHIINFYASCEVVAIECELTYEEMESMKEEIYCDHVKSINEWVGLFTINYFRDYDKPFKVYSAENSTAAVTNVEL